MKLLSMDYEKKSSLLDECRIGLKCKIRQDKESEFNWVFLQYKFIQVCQPVVNLAAPSQISATKEKFT